MKKYFKQLFLGAVAVLGLCLLLFFYSWKVTQITIPQYTLWQKNPQINIILKKIIDPTLHGFLTQWKKDSSPFLSPQLLYWKEQLEQQFWIKNIYVSRNLPANWVLDIEFFQPQYHLTYQDLSPLITLESNEISEVTEYIGNKENIKLITAVPKEQIRIFFQPFSVFRIKIADFEKKPNLFLLKKLLYLQQQCKQILPLNMKVTELEYGKTGFLTVTIETFEKKSIKLLFGFLLENKLLQQPQELNATLKQLNEELSLMPFEKIPKYIRLIR